jgi:ethanolamine utilization protein EutA (predicted chaperonin)
MSRSKIGLANQQLELWLGVACRLLNDSSKMNDSPGRIMSTDKKGTKILARTFFTQLRTGSYTPNQILDIATELIDLVTNDLKDAAPKPTEEKSAEIRH